MSRIGQMQEQKRMREDIEALRKSLTDVCAGLSDVVNQIASLRATIDDLRPIGNGIESPRGPGRPRKAPVDQRNASRSD